MPATNDPISIAFKLGLGPWLFPLRGKIPIYESWQERPPITEAEAREFVDIGYNLGLRTGARSDVFVIDDDQDKHPDSPRTFTPPTTGFVIDSPTGSAHHYYRYVEGVRNSANALAPHVDVRGEGGYVVFAGSVHPIAKRPYRLRSAVEFAECEAGVLAKVLHREKRVHVDMTAPARKRRDDETDEERYVAAALSREVHRVRTAPHGARNETLFEAARSLGQLVAGGALGYSRVESELTAAAKLVGDGEKGESKKIAGTIRSGMKSGAKMPRTVPEVKKAATATAERPVTGGSKNPAILVPGSHTLKGGEYVQQSSDAFNRALLKALPPGSLYRRGGRVGEIIHPSFQSVSAHRLRAIIDRHVELQAGKVSKEDDEPVLVYRPCSRDHAELLLAWAEAAPVETIRELLHLSTHPVCTGVECLPAKPGWNADSGTYLACDDVPDPLDLPTSRAVLEDLVCDFPFQTAADRANYFGLMLTPILRPALNEPVPMHLICAPLERSGKTKLAEIVLGCTVLGRPVPATQLGQREEEREKRLVSALLAGATVLHLDNLGEYLDSPALASLLTASTYQGRILGESRMAEMPNGLSVVGTGNNVHATGEVAKRVVPIRLMPDTESPEERTDYRHPLLRSYVEKERPRVLGALLGLVEAWRKAGRPLGSVGFGGFERWAAVMGGIMLTAGYREWMGNIRDWRGQSDDDSAEYRALVEGWHERWACQWVPASDVYEMATELDLFGWLERHKGERGKRTAFAKRVLARMVGRVIEGFRVESTGVGSRRSVRLSYVDLT